MRCLSASKRRGTIGLGDSGVQRQHPGGTRGWRCQCLPRPSVYSYQSDPHVVCRCVCVYAVSRFQSSAVGEEEQDGAMDVAWGCTLKDMFPSQYADLCGGLCT